MQAHDEDGTRLRADQAAVVMDVDSGKVCIFLPSEKLEKHGEEEVPDHVMAFIGMAMKFQDDEDFRSEMLREFEARSN